MSYLRNTDLAAFGSAIERFGASIDSDWIDASGNPTGAALFQSGQRKYTAWVTMQQEDTSFASMARTEAAGNYFKTWHWFYRLVMAGRTVVGYQQCMWDMSRIRLRDILATPWPADTGIPDIPLPNGGTRQALVGDVYTSECSNALLLRWHIRFPAHVTSGGQAGSHLRGAFGRAGISGAAGDPTAWGDVEEASLIQGMIDEVAAIGNADLINTMDQVYNWPQWATGPNPRHYRLPASIGSLRQARNSMSLDASNLPPAPY
jgi:hypothetical protein